MLYFLKVLLLLAHFKSFNHFYGKKETYFTSFRRKTGLAQ
jgi:hypothetical protein